MHNATTTDHGKFPCFDFYVADFIEGTVDMTTTEVGMYIRLLCYQWTKGAIPDDVLVISRIAGMNARSGVALWHRTKRKFLHSSDGWRNARLEYVRAQQLARQGVSGNHDRPRMAKITSGDTPASLPMQSSISVSQPGRSISTSTSSKEVQVQVQPKNGTSEVCGELHADSSPIVLTFPTIGKPSTWELTLSRIQGWSLAFSNIDVEGECRKAWAWVDANPHKRKTARGMPSFLVRWLGNAVDRPRVTAATSGSKTAGNLAALQAFAQRKKPI